MLAKEQKRHVVNTLADECQNDMTKIISNSPFSIATDGSCDRGAENQLYPMVIRYYNESVGKVVTGLLSLPAMTEICSTGKNIFNLMDMQIRKHAHNQWNNCVAYCSDNAATMMGSKSGVAAFVKSAHPEIFVTGCTCHLLHLTAGKACKEIKDIDINVLMFDISHYFELGSNVLKNSRSFKRSTKPKCRKW